MLEPTYVFVAGIDNSGPDHWQRRWYERLGDRAVWVEHDSWSKPLRDQWVADLAETLAAVPGPKILVAHSLGCSLVAEWAADHADDTVAGALLVATPDVRAQSFPADATGFGNPRYPPLPFRAVVVASEDDPYGSLESTTAFAALVGAELVNVGCQGHINAGSELGDWPAGWSLLMNRLTR